MNIVLTPNRDNTALYNTIDYIFLEHQVPYNVIEYNLNGLSKKYDCGSFNDYDRFPNFISGNYAGNCGTREFSTDNQEILKKYLLEVIASKDKINIVEIGVCSNILEESSTSVLFQNKRPNDIYVGIDIQNLANLNNAEQNIFTIQSPSENMEYILDILKGYGVNEIDLLMIDSNPTINHYYLTWEDYTKILSPNGCVVIHDTNCHPGPYFLVNSIDTRMYNVYKYLSDVQDWGISVALRNGDSPISVPVFASAPATETVVEPAAESASEPIAQPTVESVVEPIAEPTVEAVVEPAAEPTVEPTAEPAAAEPAAEPAAAEPAAEPAAAEPAAEPVVVP
jgi:hypothetical protein